MFDNIILATDFSAHARTARAATIELITGQEKKLTVLHVYDPKQKLLEEGVLMSTDFVEQAEKKRLRKEAEEMLKKYCEPLTQKNIKFDLLIREGKPAETIIKVAKEIDADLIVMGSHSKRSFIDVSLGGNTRKVGEKAPCPVLIVTHYKEKEQSPEDGKEQE